MSEERYLIVNADDFGQSAGINQGIIEAFEHGIVTSASLMVRWPASTPAANYAREHPLLSVGLHLDLGEWAYRKGDWVRVHQVVELSDANAVAAEVSRQVETFLELMGKAPTHIDSHQHVHRHEPIRSILVDTAAKLDIPLRLNSNVHYCGSFYGQTDDGAPLLEFISLEALTKILHHLEPGITELGCHPAKVVDIDTMYASERVHELRVLCDVRVLEFVTKSKIEMCSFHQLSGAER